MDNPLAADLDHVLAHTEGLWEELRGQTVFITGGTGFFGCWLLESFLWANDRLNLKATATVLTRNPRAFQQKAPRLALRPGVHLLSGDVRSFEFPQSEHSYVIHAAAESSTRLNETDPLAMFDTIVNGTRRTLDFSRRCGARGFLMVSSGAVYGRQPAEVSHVSEEYGGGPQSAEPASAYGEGKRSAELLCSIYGRQYGLAAKIARCFAFVGPYLPLDSHFAIGNFIRDGIRGGPIQVQGDGTPLRSYLYAADLAVWLWTILFRGAVGQAYNVGSEDEITIASLATKVAHAFPGNVGVHVAAQPIPGEAPSRYVPSTRKARSQLQLLQHISLEESIRRTILSHSPAAARRG